MARVLAATTSMGTKWESYSQALLALIVPDWQRIVIDGRNNWSPTGFIASVIDRDVDYIVHVDEDCFVQSREALLTVIETLDGDKNLVAAGIPDGGNYYRNHNPAALNLFFVVFKADALRSAWNERKQWDQYRFRCEFADEVIRQLPHLDQTRIQWDEGEPYYPLFWRLLSTGGRFLYLREELLKSRWSSKVLSPSGDVLAEHMWYLRQWFSHEIMPGHDCANSIRYERFLADCWSRYQGNHRLRIILTYMHARRLIRRMWHEFRP